MPMAAPARQTREAGSIGASFNAVFGLPLVKVEVGQVLLCPLKALRSLTCILPELLKACVHGRIGDVFFCRLCRLAGAETLWAKPDSGGW